jgi:hypothetical protein
MCCISILRVTHGIGTPLKPGHLSQEGSVAAGGERFGAAVVALHALSQSDIPICGDLVGAVYEDGDLLVAGAGTAAIERDEGVAQVPRARRPARPDGGRGPVR